MGASDKAYAVEQRLDALVNNLGPQVLSAPFTINTFGSNSIIFTFAVLASATYAFEGWFNVVNSTAGDAAQFQFQGPAAATSPQLVEYICTNSAVPAVVTHVASTTSYPVTFDNQAVAGNQSLIVRATVAFTASGNVTFNGQELVSGNTVVLAEGSRMTCQRIA